MGILDQQGNRLEGPVAATSVAGIEVPSIHWSLAIYDSKT